MPRKIDSRSATTTRFGIPSAKNDGMIPVESTLEAAQALRLEFAPSVSAYESQPQTFQVTHDGKVINATPDFKVYLYFDEIDFVEVKRARKVKQPPTAKRLDSIKDHLETLGFNYCVRTEKEIRSSNQVIHNCVYLNPYKWRSRDRVDELKNLVPKGPVTFLEWAEKIGDAQAVVEMMAHQLVFSDFYQRLTSDTVIRPIQDCDFAYMYA